VNKGTFGVYPGHKGLESDLFEIDFDQFFLENPLNDVVLSECLDLIFRGDGKDRGQIDFYDLGTEKIGDVYNDLLALRLVQADDGKVTLTNSDAKKKELGSYFTHSSLTSILVDGVVDFLDRRNPDHSKWIHTKICDNSCGSGHFLRDLIDRLSYEMFTSKGNTDPDSTQKIVDQTDFKRILAQHCVFGIDKDLNAVWLTKLSLWLHTAVAGKPFVFLDHHIKHGDSILARLDCVSKHYSPSDQKKLRILCEALGRTTSNSREDIVENRKLYDAVRAITAKAFKEYCAAVIETVPPPERQFFFNYQCTFPEVFPGDDSDGFEVIVGNPPWDTVKPKSRFKKLPANAFKPNDAA
jgi:hypothetical protein